MELHSIGALADCMADLRIRPAQQLTKTLEARFRNRKTMASGLIEVVINSNWNSGDGPFIEFDETIKALESTTNGSSRVGSK